MQPNILVWLGLTICLFGLACDARACSVLPTFDPVPASVIGSESAPAAAPVVTVERIVRGRVGEAGTCAELGFLTLKVPHEVLGFRIEPVSGNLGRTVFPEGFVQPREQGRLGFVWLDGNTDAQEPIDVVVRVSALSPDGVVSEPVQLRITHPGVDAVSR